MIEEQRWKSVILSNTFLGCAGWTVHLLLLRKSINIKGIRRRIQLIRYIILYLLKGERGVIVHWRYQLERVSDGLSEVCGPDDATHATANNSHRMWNISLRLSNVCGSKCVYSRLHYNGFDVFGPNCRFYVWSDRLWLCFRALNKYRANWFYWAVKLF